MSPLFTGKEITELESVHSTNSYATELLKQRMLTEGHVVWAKRQTHGRGQRGNTWESEGANNVTASVVWYPVFLPPSKQFQLTQAVSLGIADLLAHYLEKSGVKKPVHIKWPNDIFIGDQKIAGILIENSLRGGQIAVAIVGVGINVNQVSFNAPNNPTSLAKLTGKAFDIRAVIDDMCSFLEPRYLQLRAGKTAQLNNEYLARMYKLDEWSCYRAGDKIFTGMITGVADDGKLLMDLASGEKKSFDLKEVAFV
jgi:BirA family biotin operon repressor/biotin-[acetyl-CoA-carboxylase] ligase